MLVKKIAFKDFLGKEREETHYFGLSKSDMVEVELKYKGGLEGIIRTIKDGRDPNTVMEFFHSLMEMSYGILEVDGLHFRKSPEIFENFKATGAYDVFYMELFTSDTAAIDFFNGIMPEMTKEERIKADALVIQAKKDIEKERLVTLIEEAE